MKKHIHLTIILLALICVSYDGSAADYPRRIVSMSPAITETLYELNLGDRVVGVTDYCNFPEAAKKKTRTGGYLNPNYEAIYALSPDLVIMPADYGDNVKNTFDNAKIKYEVVDMLSVDGILNSIRKIGKISGKGAEAASLCHRLRSEMDSLRKLAKKTQSKHIMIVVGREKGSLNNLYVAGKGTFYDQLLSILGCENVYKEPGAKYPAISVEGIMRLDPDVIIEVLPDCAEQDKPNVISEWKILKDVKAVKNDRVYVLNGDYIAIPGPRFTLILRDIEGTL